MKGSVQIDLSRLPVNEPALVAVSGGVDSMVLLHLLARLPNIQIAHLNHGLRSKASDADERFVRQAANKLGIPCHIERSDVKAIARKQKLSIEMAARKCRHEFFARLARKLGIRTIVLAHHADDQVELFFLRLLRGAGPEGLACMQESAPSPVDTALTVFRPLLGVTKKQICAYASEHKIAFREDATNTAISILRNRIRHKLIPLLERDYQPALGKIVLRTIELIRSESEVIGTGEYPGKPFDELPVALQRRRLRRQLYSAGIDSNFDLVEHLRLNVDAAISLGPEQIVSRDPSGKVNIKKPAHWSADSLSASLAAPGSIQFGGLVLEWSFRKGKATPNTEHFDADKVGSIICLRHWQPGDRFQPIGMKHSVKLQDLFTNLKIPRHERHERVVAATAHGEIFWVEGLRIPENFKIEPATNRCLKWLWRRHETC